jgi:hypothetical protein
MNGKEMIPVHMKKVKDPDGRESIAATVPMNLVFDKSFNAQRLEEELVKLERRYFYLITCLKAIIEALRSKTQKDRRVFLYWEFGDKIQSFIDHNKDGPLFLENLSRSLIRDVEVSDKILMRCKRFRVNYPDVSRIDPNRSFDSYVATFEGGYIPKSRRGENNKKL